MILKTIACEGKVLEPWVLMDEIDVVDLESGIKKSGTFHFICRECDALYFQDYENKEALLNDPTDKMLAEIALKSMLQMISKRNEEIALFDIIQKRSGAIINKERLDEDKLLLEIIYVFLTIFLYLLKCPQSLILSALRAFCLCGKPHISRLIFLYFPCQSWLKSW